MNTFRAIFLILIFKGHVYKLHHVVPIPYKRIYLYWKLKVFLVIWGYHFEQQSQWGVTSAKPHIWFQNCTGCVGLCSVWYCNTIKDTQFHTLLNTPCISYIFVESSEEGSILPTQIPTISHHSSSQLFCSDKGQLSHIFWAVSLSYVNLLTSAQRWFLEVLSFFFLFIKFRTLSYELVILKETKKTNKKSSFP